MTVLARKITRAKWSLDPSWASGDIRADAVTADLKTTDDALSFWRCESSSEVDRADAVLAIAAMLERADKLEVVFVDESAVRAEGLATRDTEGVTPVASLRRLHVDVERLELVRLGKVARLVAAAHGASASCTLTKKQVLELLAGAIKSGLLQVTHLKDKLKEAVEKQLAAP